MPEPTSAVSVPGAPKTLLFLHSGGERIRGSEEVLLMLLSGLDPDDVRPVVLCNAPALRDAVAALGIEAELQHFPEILVDGRDRRFPARRYLRALRAIRRFAADRGAELVFCNGGGPCQLGVPVAALLRRPLVCYLHHPAHGSYHVQWLTPLAGTLLFSSRFTAEHTRARIRRAGEVVYPGIDARRRFTPATDEARDARRALGYGPDDVVFVQVGALDPHKGHRLLLDAFDRVRRELPAARLAIVGAGPEEPALRQIVAERGLSAVVRLTGYVDDVVPWFREVMDVNVLASHEEGLGLVSLQAAACEVPGVATDGTGIRETIVHEQTGLLFPDGDVGALAAAMLRLGRDDGLRAALGRDGRRRVLERFSDEVFCARIREVIQARIAGRYSRSAEPDATAAAPGGSSPVPAGSAHTTRAAATPVAATQHSPDPI